jgi:hypothetical protein
LSKILHKNDVESSIWQYPALVAEKNIEDFIKKQFIDNKAIPRGIFEELEKFFELALKATETSSPISSISSYRIAANAMRNSIPSIAENRVDFEINLKEFANLFSSFKTKRPCKSQELVKLKNLKKFFHQLYISSEDQTYENTLASKY